VRQTYYIIVVEEDEFVYEKIVRALGSLGQHHDVRRVTSQEELDDELVRLAPDFVICAKSRSEWNSFAVLKQVRDFQPSMPFALISGGRDDPQALLAGGMDACIDCDHLSELAPTVQEMLKRCTERQGRSVAEIRRSMSPFPRRRRAIRRDLKAG
jgi:two-component SAPR family response regulator